MFVTRALNEGPRLRGFIMKRLFYFTKVWSVSSWPPRAFPLPSFYFMPRCPWKGFPPPPLFESLPFNTLPQGPTCLQNAVFSPPVRREVFRLLPFLNVSCATFPYRLSQRSQQTSLMFPFVFRNLSLLSTFFLMVDLNSPPLRRPP